MGYHDFFKSGDVQVRTPQSGTFINEQTNGTAAAGKAQAAAAPTPPCKHLRPNFAEGASSNGRL